MSFGAAPSLSTFLPLPQGDVRGGGGSLHREDQGGEPADQRHRQGQVARGLPYPPYLIPYPLALIPST